MDLTTQTVNQAPAIAGLTLDEFLAGCRFKISGDTYKYYADQPATKYGGPGMILKVSGSLSEWGDYFCTIRRYDKAGFNYYLTVFGRIVSGRLLFANLKKAAL